MRRTPSCALVGVVSTLAVLTGCHTSTVLRPPDANGLRDREGRRVTVDEDDLLLIDTTFQARASRAVAPRIALRGPVEARGDGDEAVFEAGGRRTAVRLEDIERVVLREPNGWMTFVVLGGIAAALGGLVALAALDREEPRHDASTDCDADCARGLVYVIAILGGI